MIHELRKLLTNRYVLFLLIGAVVLNGILFYRHCNSAEGGHTLSQMRQVYDLPMQELQEREQALRERRGHF